MAKKSDITLGQAIKTLSLAVCDTSDFFSELDPADLPQLLKAFKLLRQNRDDLKICFDTIEALYKKCSEETIPNTFESMGFDSVKAHGRNFIVSTQLNASIPMEMRSIGYEWLKENGLSSLIQDNVNAQTLSAAIRQYFEREGKLPPEGAIKIYHKKYTSIRSA